MSITSIENPNLAKDVSLARGTNSTQVKPWLEEPKFSWRKELGEALVGCPRRVSVVRPEGKREPGKVQSQCWLWEGVGRRGRFRHLRNPTNRMGGSIFTEPWLILNTTLLTRDWCRHFSPYRHPFPPCRSHYKWKQTEGTLLRSWLWHHPGTKGRILLLKINNGSKLWNHWQTWPLGNIHGFLCPKMSGRLRTVAMTSLINVISTGREQIQERASVSGLHLPLPLSTQ